MRRLRGGKKDMCSAKLRCTYMPLDTLREGEEGGQHVCIVQLEELSPEKLWDKK